MGNGVVEHAMKPKSRQNHKTAILLLEEAVHLLRKAPLYLFSSYYIGTLPFILGLFYFWADMSRSADAKSYHAVASLGLVLLYIWMKCWHAVFAARVKMVISGQPAQRWPFQQVSSLMATQTLIHATAFFILPAAALIALPFGWCYAFYQNVTAESLAEADSPKALCQRAWFQARLWPRQNHILLSVFFLFGTVVFLNVATAIYLLPHLMKNYLGIESIFTLSGSHVINTTFWVVTIGITYLCMNPLVKTVYILRCFYGAALKSGDDLKTELKSMVAARTGAAISILVVVLFAGNLMPAMAADKRFVTPEALDHSIDEVMEQREFTWRMPREAIAENEKEPKGPIASVVEWVVDRLSAGLKAIIDWIDKLIDWLIKLLPTGDRPVGASDKNWISSVRVAVMVLLIGLLCGLIYILWRSWIRRQAAQDEIIAAAVSAAPDLEDEDTSADDLPANRWLELAHELADKGSYRLAIRAFYLATLSNLAEHELITIEKYKSNQEYEKELHRRAHQIEGLLPAFTKSRAIFECAWYGLYSIKQSDLKNFEAAQKRMMTIAQS